MPAPLRCVTVVFVVIALTIAAVPAGRSAEMNTNRGGGDYTSMDLSAPDPGLCEAACAGDGRCQAWTYVQPGVQGPSARCWLKDSVPPPTADGCCVSGVKAQSGTFRSRWDKVGGPGGGWSTGWVNNVPRRMCASTVGCACGGANYCGEFPSGAVIPNWPNGCAAPAWQLQCTSEPQ